MHKLYLDLLIFHTKNPMSVFKTSLLDYLDKNIIHNHELSLYIKFIPFNYKITVLSFRHNSLKENYFIYFSSVKT